MQLHIGEVLQVLAEESQAASVHGRTHLANAAKSLVERAQQRERDALEFKQRRQKDQFYAIFRETTGVDLDTLEGRKVRNANGHAIVLDPRD